MISSRLRRAIHDAVDIVLDALAEDGRAPANPRRKRAPAALPDPSTVTPEALAKADAALRRAGLG